MHKALSQSIKTCSEVEEAADRPKMVAGEAESKDKHLYCWERMLVCVVVAAPVLTMMCCKLPLLDLPKQPVSGFSHLLLITGTRLFHFPGVFPNLLNVQLHLLF